MPSLSQMTLEILDAYGWSEADLAGRLGCSQPHVNRLKRNLVPRPSFDLGTRLHRLYEDRPVPAQESSGAA